MIALTPKEMMDQIYSLQSKNRELVRQNKKLEKELERIKTVMEQSYVKVFKNDKRG